MGKVESVLPCRMIENTSFPGDPFVTFDDVKKNQVSDTWARQFFGVGGPALGFTNSPISPRFLSIFLESKKLLLIVVVKLARPRACCPLE